MVPPESDCVLVRVVLFVEFHKKEYNVADRDFREEVGYV